MAAYPFDGRDNRNLMVCGAVDQKGCRKMTVLIIKVNVAAIVWALAFLAATFLT